MSGMEGGLLGDGVRAAALWGAGDERGRAVFQTVMEHSAPEGLGMTWADERNRGWRLNCRGDVKGGLLGDVVRAVALWDGGDERGMAVFRP